MPLVLRLDDSAVAPETGAPAPDLLIAGDPRHRTWNHEDFEGLSAGTWESTPGKWRVEYAEWEYVRILAGHSILTGDDGSVQHLRAGDRAVIRPGFRGTWEVVETTRKDYVIRA
jgi:uncharacterized cupin superfamily protein